MKRLLLITALLPFAVLAQPINTLNNPHQPGYQIPSQQRMQTQMQTQQIQQQGMLKQQMQTQARSQQQNLQSQLNANTQRVQQGQPGNGMLGQQNAAQYAGRNAQRQRKSGPDAKSFPANVAAGQRDAAA
ncbi:membrane protein [Salmonella enterica subsp. salamae]|uniref:Membrane protein n=1 Tax=Salmonella enterica subsp. salamae TaxID=59202 RepID=A0A6D2G3N5_SALER|nr:membrane protein [Salmonella enterica subsp. salamae]